MSQEESRSEEMLHLSSPPFFVPSFNHSFLALGFSPNNLLLKLWNITLLVIQFSLGGLKFAQKWTYRGIDSISKNGDLQTGRREYYSWMDSQIILDRCDFDNQHSLLLLNCSKHENITSHVILADFCLEQQNKTPCQLVSPKFVQRTPSRWSSSVSLRFS